MHWSTFNHTVARCTLQSRYINRFDSALCDGFAVCFAIRSLVWRAVRLIRQPYGRLLHHTRLVTLHHACVESWLHYWISCSNDVIMLPFAVAETKCDGVSAFESEVGFATARTILRQLNNTKYASEWTRVCVWHIKDLCNNGTSHQLYYHQILCTTGRAKCSNAACGTTWENVQSCFE